jgi:hypothetical protein
MSFLITAPETVTAAAGNLAGIGSTLGEATAAAAGPTTTVAAAAADEVSIAISEVFGRYGQQFQALSAQAATLHNEFVSLLNGGAAAYLNTEITNAQQSLVNAMNASAPIGASVVANTVAAATDPILGGLSPIFVGGTGGGILGGMSPALNGLTSIITGGPLGPILHGAGQQNGAAVSALTSGDEGSLLSGLFAAGATASAAGGPWQVLFANTAANLQTIFGTGAAHPFPVLQQVIINQNGYAQTFGSGLAVALQNFPITLANVPANVVLGIQGTSTFGAVAQALIDEQNGFAQPINTSLQNFFPDLQQRLPVFEADIAVASQALVTGDYHGAVQDVPRAVLNLFLSGIDLSNVSDIEVQGPAGDLLPALSLSAQLEPSFVNLLPPGSIPAQIAQNFVNAVNAGTDSLGFALIGPPIATLDGLATGATAFGAAVQTGNGVAAVGALVDMPAFVLNGFLNGDTIVDLTIPVTETVDIPATPPLPATTIGAGTPIVIQLPFEGILTPAQPITATVDIPAGVFTIPLTPNLGDIQVAGAVPTLLNNLPEQIASAISPE